MQRRSTRHDPRPDPLRLALAQEAARIMIEQGIDDYLFAKRKAADRLRIRDQSVLPSNAEIEAAVAEQQRLFHAESQQQHLRTMRQTALRLMRLLHDFEPRLVGSALSGTATQHSELTLHVFADQPELVALRLLEQHIVAKHAEKKLRYEAERWLAYPSFKFLAGDQGIEIVTLTRNDLRQAPLSPVDGKPMQRADIDEVASLI